MPAKSRSQQRLMGMVHAYNKGEFHGSRSMTKFVASVAKNISDEDARHFAETPHSGLPEKVDKKAQFDEASILSAMRDSGYAPGVTDDEISRLARYAQRTREDAIDRLSGEGKHEQGLLSRIIESGLKGAAIGAAAVGGGGALTSASIGASRGDSAGKVISNGLLSLIAGGLIGAGYGSVAGGLYGAGKGIGSRR